MAKQGLLESYSKKIEVLYLFFSFSIDNLSILIIKELNKEFYFISF